MNGGALVPTSPTVRFTRRLSTGVALAFALVGCSASQRAAPTGSGAVLFDGTIQQLVPLHAGDWFVYRSRDGAGGEHLERSELTTAKRAHELLLTVNDNGATIARIHLRLDEDAVRVISEMDLRSDVGAIYATPLPLYAAPLREHATASSTVEVVRISDGHQLDHGDVELQVTSARDAANGDIVSRIDRKLVLSGGVLPNTLAMWIRPGIGQIATEGAGGERRELVCARIGGTSFGTCP